MSKAEEKEDANSSLMSKVDSLQRELEQKEKVN